MGVLLLLYGNVSSARNPDITATPYAMARINNLKANDFQKIPGRSSSNPYYALKDTYRARFIAGLPGFEYQNIASSTLTPSVKSYSFDFAQMSYNLNNDKGICSSFTSAVSRTTLGNLKVGTKMLKGSKLKQGTILTTKPKAGGSGHIVLLMKVRKK